jgi:hypothetical protein
MAAQLAISCERREIEPATSSRTIHRNLNDIIASLRAESVRKSLRNVRVRRQIIEVNDVGSRRFHGTRERFRQFKVV